MFPKVNKRRPQEQNIKSLHLPPLQKQVESCKLRPLLNTTQVKPEHRLHKNTQNGKCVLPPLIIQHKPLCHPALQKMFSKLPDILSKPKGTYVVKTNHQESGFLPNINKTEQRINVGVQQKTDHGSMKKTFLEELVIRPHHSQHSKQQKDHNKEVHFPMTPTDVLNSYQKKMTKYERTEICQFPEIWYLGHITQKSVRFFSDGVKPKFVHIAYRYEVLGTLGSGSYGHVYKCLDHKNSEMVAIKVMSTGSIMMNEPNILDFLKGKDKSRRSNIIHMKESFHFREHLCIVFELAGPSLFDVLQKNNSKGMSLTQVRQIAQELLKCLSLLEREKIIHGDLKPENITLSPKEPNGLKVIDFGLSCFEHLQEHPLVGTLVYNAPEVLVQKRHTTAIDMWSLACTLCELYTGNILFNGMDEIDQMACIMQVLGTPPSDLVSSKKELFVDSKGQAIRMKDPSGSERVLVSQKLSSRLKTDNKQFLNFIQRCLTWDPKKRLTASEALKHQWIRGAGR